MINQNSSQNSSQNPFQNPFQNPEPRQSLFESIDSYQYLKKKSLQKFYQRYKPNSNLQPIQFLINTLQMPFSFSFLQNTFQKFSMTITVGLAVVTLVVSALTAQAVAPTEYKLFTLISNLFLTNNQQVANPYTALQPDKQSNVVDFKGCDLSVKYNKKIDTLPIVAKLLSWQEEKRTKQDFEGSEVEAMYFHNNPNKTKQDFQKHVEQILREDDSMVRLKEDSNGNILYIEPDQSSKEFKANQEQIDKNFTQYEDADHDLTKPQIAKLNNTKFVGRVEIECQDQPYILTEIEQKNLKEYLAIENLHSVQLADWFTTQIEDESIYIEDYIYQYQKNDTMNITFKFEDKYYMIHKHGVGIDSDQIQIRFNSLIEDQASD